ncbi:MAG TPA: YfhO family protein [Syntrophorhabdaceae bacterium]|nr:YfhO family protein [Syntrophorhabdaceae bacterium]
MPPRYLWINIIKDFNFPFWNPHNYSGIPLIATLQPGIFYPPHILYLFLPFNIVWNWLIILHFVFAGVTIYIFLRYLRASPIASFVGGVTFMLSGYLLSVHSLLPHLLAVPWFPLVVMSFLKYLEKKRTKYIIFTGVCVTMEFFAGAPEIVMITFFVIGIVALFPEVFVTEKVNIPFRFKAIATVGVIFLLLSSAQLLPFYELKTWSIRHSGLNFKEATTWSFAWKDFMLFFLPDLFGYFKTFERYWGNQSWLKTMYLGIIPFAFSIFFFLSKDKKRLLFIVLIIGSFLLAMGKYTPFYSLLYYIPPFNSIRYPVKFLFLFFFVISLTAGLGLDRLRNGIEQKDKKTKIIIHYAFYSGFISAILWGFLYLFDIDVHRFTETYGFTTDAYNDIKFNLHNLKRFLLFTFIFCAMLLVYLRVKFKKVVMFIIICILLLDLFLANYGFYQVTAWNWYISNNGYIDRLVDGTKDTGRYFVTYKSIKNFENYPYDRYALTSSYAALFGLYTVGGAEVMRVIYQDIFLRMLYYRNSLSDAKSFFDMSGVRYVITSYKVDDADLKLIKSMDVVDKTAYLYEYKKYPGRFLLYSRVSFARDDGEVIEKFQSNVFDPREELILLKPTGVNSLSPSPQPSPARGEGDRKVNSPSANRLPPSPLTPTLSRQGRGRPKGQLTKCQSFTSVPPHPNPLPPGERGQGCRPAGGEGTK